VLILKFVKKRLKIKKKSPRKGTRGGEYPRFPFQRRRNHSILISGYDGWISKNGYSIASGPV
jgi:hypothetical protein